MGQSGDNLLHRIIGPRLAAAPGAETPVCDACHSDAVALAEWGELADGQWRVLLRCGECGTWHEIVIDQAVTEALDETLDDGMESIACDLEAIDRDRMAAQVEAFAIALARDLIDADDFAAPR